MVRPETLPELVAAALDRFERPVHFGCHEEGRWQTLPTVAIRDRRQHLAAALHAAGIERGDRVAIVAPTSLEWVLCDYAVTAIGAVVVPVYPTLTGEQTAYILNHAGAKLAFAGNPDLWRKVAAVGSACPALDRVVSFAAVAGEGAETLAEFVAAGGELPDLAPPAPGDLASIIYTSGTTGQPKGVMLTHANIVSNVLGCTEACPFTVDDVHLSFLPLSHIFERMVHYYMLWNGLTIYLLHDISDLRAMIGEVRPTIMTSVPRVFEKVLAAIEDKARERGAIPGRLARFAIDTSREWARQSDGVGTTVSPVLSLKHAIADRLVLRKVRALLGGRLRCVVTGGAATPGVVTEFFRGLGIAFIPGYGLTESSPVIAFNTLSDFRFGSVGRPIPGVEVQIAEDGEILARGANVMRGYYQNDEATAGALAADGWLRTGDIGRVDDDGFLFITDRKKDLLVTAQGKNVAPQPIEQSLVQDSYIAQAMLVGDGRPYVTALLVPSYGALEGWARRRGLDSSDRAALLRHPDVQKLYDDRVARCCASLAGYESVKRFALLADEFTEAAGELTPTLKIKRRVVVERQRDVIESLYA